MNNVEVSYNRFCIGRFSLPCEQDIVELEQRWRIMLPPDYRTFLLSYNGGEFSEPLIKASDPSCPLDNLMNLAGIHASDPFLELGSGVFSPDQFDDNEPPQIVGIGDTPVGNLLVLVTDVNGKDRGSIRLKMAFSDKSYYLAAGIDEFFGLLSANEA